MSYSTKNSYRERVSELIGEYESKGFFVEQQPRLKAFGAYTPDFVATRGAEKIVVEVKYSSGSREDDLRRADQLAQYAEIASKQGWQFEVVVIGPKRPQKPMPENKVELRFTEAEKLLKNKHIEAALLIAWSALEAVLRRYAEKKRHTGPSQPASLIKNLYAEGLISEQAFRVLQRANIARGRLAHGMDVKPPSSDLIREIIEIGRKYSSSHIPTVNEMVDWFFANYEDPAQHVPFETREGGYQYFAGGPYDAREVLEDQFSDAFPEDLDDAVDLVERQGVEWVKVGEY